MQEIASPPGICPYSGMQTSKWINSGTCSIYSSRCSPIKTVQNHCVSSIPRTATSVTSTTTRSRTSTRTCLGTKIQILAIKRQHNIRIPAPNTQMFSRLTASVARRRADAVSQPSLPSQRVTRKNSTRPALLSRTREICKLSVKSIHI